jgi:hypothetical protein
MLLPGRRHYKVYNFNDIVQNVIFFAQFFLKIDHETMPPVTNLSFKRLRFTSSTEKGPLRASGL